jgi:hypothetical protein
MHYSLNSFQKEYDFSNLVCEFHSFNFLLWFCNLQFAVNTRVVDQKELEVFREEMEKYKSSNYNVIIKGKNLPM